MRVLVTGANGFVGRVVCETLTHARVEVRAALRRETTDPIFAAEKAVVGEIGPDTDWTSALRGVDCVVHLAARVHVMQELDSGADLYARTNSEGTLRLAEAACRAEVKRFLYLSSVKVNGEEGSAALLSATDMPQPHDAYARSKYDAEQGLLKAAGHSTMTPIIVRSPLVYGAGVRANFLRLMQWVDRERLLPLGAVRNSRSLVSAWNLADFLRHLIQHPDPPAGVWMASDGEDLSTPELIQKLAVALDRRARLISVPVGVLRFVGSLVGKEAEIARLCGSLAVDSSPARQVLGWVPPLTVSESLARTADWYRSARSQVEQPSP